jgi:DNA repair exonuclease SbcCD ATPase subunit
VFYGQHLVGGLLDASDSALKDRLASVVPTEIWQAALERVKGTSKAIKDEIQLLRGQRLEVMANAAEIKSRHAAACVEYKKNELDGASQLAAIAARSQQLQTEQSLRLLAVSSCEATLTKLATELYESSEGFARREEQARSKQIQSQQRRETLAASLGMLQEQVTRSNARQQRESEITLLDTEISDVRIHLEQSRQRHSDAILAQEAAQHSHLFEVRVLETRLQTLQAELRDVQSVWAVSRDNERRIRDSLFEIDKVRPASSLPSPDRRCPSCGQAIDIRHLEQHRVEHMQQLETAVHAATKHAEQMKVLRESVEALTARLANVPAAARVPALARAAAQTSAARDAVVKAEAQLEQLQKQARDWESSEQFSAIEHSQLESQCADVQRELRACEEQIELMQVGAAEQAMIVRRHMAELHRRRQEAELQLQRARALEAELLTLDRGKSQTHHSLLAKEKELDAAMLQLASTNSRLASLAAQVEQKEKALAQASQLCDLFGRKGLQNFIFEVAAAELQKRADSYMHILCG